jgi:beta-carotene 3-hydroxylase
MKFALITLTTFFAMEATAYLAHRFLFHGPLWFLHRSHHEPKKGWFEWNDIFGFFFAPVAVILMSSLIVPEWRSAAYPMGLGMTLYGCVYFFIHDIYTHRRFLTLNFKSRWFRDMRAAHRYHHADVSKKGQEPFGFLYFQHPAAVRIAANKKSRRE